MEHAVRPRGTVVNIPQSVTFRSEANFARLTEFHPERFLKDRAEFEVDNREALQPFALGPRNRIGKNLAYGEVDTGKSYLEIRF